MKKILALLVVAVASLMSVAASAGEVFRLAPGEVQNFPTWTFQNVVSNEVRLAVGIGSVNTTYYANNQAIVSYQAPAERLTGVDHMYMIARDRSGYFHARRVGTVVFGSPKTSEFTATTTCVGQESVLPANAGDTARPFLILPLKEVHAERPSDLEVTLSGSSYYEASFVRVKPLVPGTLRVIMVTSGSELRHAVIHAVECSP